MTVVFKEAERANWDNQLKKIEFREMPFSKLGFKGCWDYEKKALSEKGSLRYLSILKRYPKLCVNIDTLSFSKVCFRFENSLLLIKFLDDLPNLDFLYISISVSSTFNKNFFPFLSTYLKSSQKKINFTVIDLTQSAFEAENIDMKKLYFCVSNIASYCKSSFSTHLDLNIFNKTEKYFYTALERSNVKGELGNSFTGKAKDSRFLEVLIIQKIKVTDYI